jgi:hypothetical protein
LQDPTRIFSSGKSSFQFFPECGKVIACKGDKNVYEVDRCLARVAITARFTFSASGIIYPTVLVCPYLRIPSEITKRVPDDWSMTVMFRIFEELVGSQLTTEFKIREDKMRQNLCSRD